MIRLPIRHRIASANLYVGNPAPRRGVERLVSRLRPWRRPDSIGLQEVGDHIGELEHVPGYKLVVTPWGDRYDRSNAILVRDDLKIVLRKHITAAAGAGTKYTPKRTIVLAGYEKRGVRVLHINTHMHVVPEERLPEIPPQEWPLAAKQYAAHAERIVELVDEYEDLGWTVFVTADANTRPREGVQDWLYSLYRLLGRHAGMQVVRRGVDLIAFNPHEVELLDERMVSRYTIGSDDHDAIAIRAKRRKR